ncbi:nitrate reductase associated protein, partial [Prochlorothrix hollandica]
MTPFFQFETDFVESLRCIPLVVRYKLDRCGVKLKLQHWHQLSHGERQQLVDQEVETPGAIAAYRALIHRQVLQYAPIPPADLPIPDRFPWQDLTVV